MNVETKKLVSVSVVRVIYRGHYYDEQVVYTATNELGDALVDAKRMCNAFTRNQSPAGVFYKMIRNYE